MKIVAIDSFLITLPFRFAFKHSLASRDQSQNLIVRVVLEDGGKSYVGYGEGIPRDYVTGEDGPGSLNAIGKEYAPPFLNASFATSTEFFDALKAQWTQLNLSVRPQGASWCAFELAMLDAVARASQTSVWRLLLPESKVPAEAIRYGAVIPFGGVQALTAMLWFYKLYGFRTVKIKVGKDLELDLYKLKLARTILGPRVVIRVDANCAWTLDEALRATEKMRHYGVKSYEQPLVADNLEAMAQLTKAVPEQIMADESLCTVDDAQRLAAGRICSAFNIRISKVGGIFAAAKIAECARVAGIACHMGAQVGESGILSAAGRSFAAIQPAFDNYEGSNNFFLLKEDITFENLNVGLGGFGKLLKSDGLGVTVNTERLKKFRDGAGDIDVQQPLFSERVV